MKAMLMMNYGMFASKFPLGMLFCSEVKDTQSFNFRLIDMLISVVVLISWVNPSFFVLQAYLDNKNVTGKQQLGARLTVSWLVNGEGEERAPKVRFS